MKIQIEYKQLQDFYWILVPLMILLVAYLGQKKKHQILKWLELSFIDKHKWSRTLAFILGIGLIFYALLGPQQEVGAREVESIGSDIYILMDTSKSMLAEDVIPSRIERSKKIVEGLIEDLEGDRIGFIPYASSAYIQMPLTDDYALAKMYLDVIDTDMVGGGGTDVGQAIALAQNAFENAGAKNQVLLILSDGEEEDISIDKVKKLVSDSDLSVYTVGIGTSEGSLIPIYNEAKTKVVAYKKDNNNNLVMSKLDATTLKTIAAAGNGEYYQTDNRISEVPNLLTSFSKLEKDKTSTRQIKEYNQLFQWFLGVGMLLLILSFKLPKRGIQE